MLESSWLTEQSSIWGLPKGLALPCSLWRAVGCLCEAGSSLHLGTSVCSVRGVEAGPGGGIGGSSFEGRVARMRPLSMWREGWPHLGGHVESGSLPGLDRQGSHHRGARGISLLSLVESLRSTPRSR